VNSRMGISSRAIVVCASLFSVGMAFSQQSAGGNTAGVNARPWSELNPVTRLTAETFANPPATDRPWVRVNLPAEQSPAELKAEIAEMHEHGIAGLEIGQGAFPKTEQLVAILQAANELGVKVSLSHGPTVSPAGYSFDEVNVRKTLLFTATKVAAGAETDITLTAPLPPSNARGRAPAAPPAPRRSTLVAVLAYRCAQGTCAKNDPVELEPVSVVNLTSSLTDTDKNGILGGTTSGHLKWTAPAGGDWRVISFWSQGAFAQPDVFSKEGTDDLIRGMEADWTPEVKALLKQNGGDIFYDSHSSDRGSPAELWTNDMEAEFKARRGYSLILNAPALFEKNFFFSDGSAPRVRNDLNAVRGDLWVEKHLKPMEASAHTFNYKIRLQPYGEATTTTPDEIQAAATLDRPENESLFMGDEVDSYLPIASANHMTGNTWYSTECCAALNKSYAQTFQDLVIRMHRSYAGGITKLVYHVYPYRDAADSKWPGYHSFGQTGFSNAWGPRNPFWIDAPVYNDYLARNQQVLTQGDAKVDVAVYMQSYLFPQPMFVKGGFHIWADPKLQEAGYTRDYLDPTLLALSSATVTAGRLATSRAAYKVFVIDSEQQPAADPIKTSMPLDVARRILAFAKAGLPVVIVGKAPNQTPGRTPKEDVELQGLMSQLVKIKNVHQVAHEGDVPVLLHMLGIRPAMEPKSASPVLSVRRRDASTRTDYYFLYNEGMVSPPNEPGNLFEPAEGKPFDQEVRLEGEGKPYLMDAWTGKITPVAKYVSSNGGVSFHLNIAPDDAALVAVSATGFGAPATDAAGDGGATSTVVPAAIDLTNSKWHLSVEDWRPANPYQTTTGVKAAETTKETVQVDIEGLKPWPKIPALKDVSGVGTYTASFEVPSDWKSGYGALLTLGEVFDSFTLSVNGKNVPINQISAAAEVGPYLHAGSNTIEVRVATTLNNRLSSLDPDVAKRDLIQGYGLIGPVVLMPH
jgi:hypothetical protein